MANSIKVVAIRTDIQEINVIFGAMNINGREPVIRYHPNSRRETTFKTRVKDFMMVMNDDSLL